VKKLFISIAVLLLSVAMISAAYAAEANARQLIDHLYLVGGQMPIGDMVIELEENVASTEGQGSQTMSSSGKDKIYFKSPNKLRIDIVTSDPGGALDQKNMVIIRDGKNAWQYLSTGQYPVKKKVDEPSAPLNIPFGIVKYPQDIDKNYTVTGTEMIDNVQTTMIKITNPTNPNEETTVWIDKARWVPLKLFVKSKGDKGEVKKTVFYKEINKTKDGRFFPFRLDIMRNDVLQRVIVYKAIAFNVGLDETLFAPMEKFVK
jgi:outer membrane lipoprotein-sorting protein